MRPRRAPELLFTDAMRRRESAER